MIKKENLKIYAPLVLRLGLAVVFFLFGYQKLSVPEQTRAEIQLLLDIGLGSAAAINYYLGLIEIVIAFSFFFGVFIQYLAPLAAFLLLGFFSSFLWKYGLNTDPALFRDIGLLGGALSLWLIGGGILSFDDWRSKKPQVSETTPLQ
ncbi:MAG: DoxX family protein, partial [Patescibacteria group bacterium]